MVEIIGQRQDEETMIENSYWFGQFLAYHYALTIIETTGIEQAVKFMKKKRTDIGIANIDFVTMADKITKENIKKYFADSMESKKTFIKGEQHD